MTTLLFIISLASSMNYSLTLSAAPPVGDCQHIDADNHRIIVCADESKKIASLHIYPIIPFDQEQ